jgi:hypothetical protein
VVDLAAVVLNQLVSFPQASLVGITYALPNGYFMSSLSQCGGAFDPVGYPKVFFKISIFNNDLHDHFLL